MCVWTMLYSVVCTNSTAQKQFRNVIQTLPLRILHFRSVIETTADVTIIDVLLTVHFSIFILVINQLDTQNLFYSKIISYLYMF